MSLALFAPCYVDQLHPQAAIAALDVLERLGLEVDVPFAAACCGQPPSNAGFEREGLPALQSFVRTFADYEHIVILSGSCTLHVRAHAASLGASGASVAERSVEFCSYLHDIVGVERVRMLGASFSRRVALHIGCHGLRGLGLASPSEMMTARFDKVRALLATVRGVSFAEPTRADECCGFGGSFAVSEPDVSARMGRDRLDDYVGAGTDVVASTDMSCIMHLDGLARRQKLSLPMMHVAQVLAMKAS